MPNLAEMQLLNQSVGGLADTLQRNREMARRQRVEDALLQERAGERADTQETRRQTLALTAEHQKQLETLAKEKNATLRDQGGLKLLKDLNEKGALTDEGLAALNAKINEQFANTGLAVQLVRKAQKPTPETYYDPDTGEPVADYMGNTLLRRPPSRDQGDIETTEYDPNTNEAIKRVVRRKLGATSGAPPEDPNAGPGLETPLAGSESEGDNVSRKGFLGYRKGRGIPGIVAPGGAGSVRSDIMDELKAGNLQPAWGPPPAARAASIPPQLQPSVMPASKQLTPELAVSFLKQAGGDKEKARQLARAAGYDF